jgi:hypothetical protein
MRLTELLDRYCLEHELSKDYSYQLSYAVNRFHRFLGAVADVNEIDEDRLNQWLLHEQQLAQINDRGRRNVRASLLTLLRYAESGLRMDRVRRVKVSAKPPEAWNVDQLGLVAQAADQLEGTMQNGLSRAEYFSTVLWFAFETGLRRSDIWRFNLDRLDQQNQASLTQHKTGHMHLVQVLPRTRAALDRLAARLRANGAKYHRTPLFWPHHWSVFYYWLAKAREKAGVDADVLNRALQHVRRTGATAVECEQHDAAPRYLGHHSGPSLARASYIDPRKVGQAIMPPVVQRHASSQSASNR